MVDFMFHVKRCNVWGAPGTGKTSAVYSFLDLLVLCGSNFLPVLIIGPLAVARDVWPAEQAKWTDFKHLRIVPIIGSTPRARTNCLLIKGDVYTINYENLPWLVGYFGERWPFQIVVADESTRLRGYRDGQGTKRSSALASVAHKVHRWVNLTGTPSPHGLESLWGQQWFIDFGARLGTSYSAFMKRGFVVEQYTRAVIPRAGTREWIYDALKDCSIAIRTEDWLPVHEVNRFERRVTLPEDAMKQYRQMAKKMFAEMPTGTITVFNALVKSIKLVQMASGSIYDEMGETHHVHDAKLDALRSLYDELGENLLVVYHFKFDSASICAKFPEAVMYKGKEQEDLWNAGRIGMLLVHPKSAGHGLSLQHGGRAVCFFTNTFDLELRLQVLERIGPARQLLSGYDRPVLSYDLIANGTIDDHILSVIDGRATEQQALMAARAQANA